MIDQRILITGASGIVGRLMRPRLRRDGRVLRLLDITAPAPAEPGEPVETITGSVTDPDVMARACEGSTRSSTSAGTAGRRPGGRRWRSTWTAPSAFVEPRESRGHQSSGFIRHRLLFPAPVAGPRARERRSFRTRLWLGAPSPEHAACRRQPAEPAGRSSRAGPAKPWRHVCGLFGHGPMATRRRPLPSVTTATRAVSGRIRECSGRLVTSGTGTGPP